MKSTRLGFAALILSALVAAWFVFPRTLHPHHSERDPRRDVTIAPPMERSPGAPLSLRKSSASRPASISSTTADEHSPVSITFPAAADPVAEPQFAAFNHWLERFAGASAPDRASLEREGIALGIQRRAAMLSLIQSNPKRALELAMPRTTAQALPAAVSAQLESQVSARGDYDVLAALPLPGHEKEVAPITRTMTVGEKTYRAFTYGERTTHPTKRRLPFHGIAIDDALAISDDPVRVLSPDEAKALHVNPADVVCAISGQPADSQGEPAVLDIGGELIWTCHYDHINELRQQQLAAAGTVDGTSVDGVTAESNYTEGRKRIIVFRVAFPNVTTPAMTVAAGYQMITNINTFWRVMSYGRTTAAMPGQGSDVVLVTLTLNSTNYDGDAGKLRTDVRAAATTAGIDLSKYDFDMTCVGATPAYTFAGLGYVGAPGVWLANSYFGAATACHELGHNLGNPHANYWDTTGQSDVGPGGNEEYGDPYDIMGSGSAYSGHYVNKFKWRIGWIPTNDFPRITSSGLYRIYSHDNIDSTGLRGLRFRRDASLDYHVEFRQLHTGNNWMMNGLKLMWGDPNGWTSQMIDTTPGSPDGKNDIPIVIGRTWSDTTAGVHLTPIGKGNTYPESIDVVVNFGTFPGNQPPALSISASALTAATGAGITFAATATDPNNDSLAYYWEFDDGTYSVNNSPLQTHTFSTAGDYIVRCVVSDMKGGRAADTVLVRIGSPSTFTISGRVLDSNRPLEGVLMKAGSRTTYTRSDGTYTITRLAAGNYTVTAQQYPATLISPWAPQTVTVGPNATNIDFINLPGGLPSATLVATGSVWKYLDNGSDQGTAWIATNFNDTAWASGPAMLGYGDAAGGQTPRTVVSFGPDANNKYITTYFRRAFTITDPTTLTNLILRLQRDDGGIVYLNGVEVFRDSMPPGAVNYRTLASTTTDGEWVQAPLNRSYLVPGTNVFAVEIHQVLGNSSDISFDLSLSGTSTTSTQKFSELYVAAPAGGSTFTTPTNVTVRATANFSSDSFTLLEFYADGVKFGQSSTAPYSALWANPSEGSHVLTVRGTVASGGFQTSAPVNVTVSAPVAPATAITLIPQGSTWKYLDNGSNQGTNWANPGFNDSTWASGPAQLGYGDGDESTVLGFGGNASAKYTTYYFRRTFTVADPTLITNLTVSLLRDDGGIVYLNGVEIFRSNMPNGPVSYTTLASSAASDDGTIFFSNPVNPSLLTFGTNLLAVEIHQDAANSSDISFDLRLTGLVASNRTRGAYLVAPANGQSYTAPASPMLTAVAVPAPGESIASVAFYSGASLLGETDTQPFTFTWANAPVGTFDVYAVAAESSGAMLTSAPVTLTIEAPAVAAELVPPGSLWRYLDDGSNQGTAWRARLFDDSEWGQGFARLGYGTGREVTTVSYGSDPSKRYITTYFRRAFNVTSTAFSNLKLLLTRDDGAVVYLNGVEVYRSNMQTNVISYNSLAASTVSTFDRTNWLAADISSAPLVAGTNVIAVEVHQAALNSADLGFDLQLLGQNDTNITAGVYLVAPAQGAHVTLPTTIQLAAFAVAPAGSDVASVAFYVDGSLLGSDATPPYTFNWSGASVGEHVLTAHALFADSTTITSAPVNVVVDGPALQVSAVLQTFIGSGSLWRYWSNGVQPAANWTALDYNDSAWPNAAAKFGWGLDGEVTTLPSGRTHYFRRVFNVSNPALISDLVVQLQRDDGAVVYLNGVELFRSNMASGLVFSNTLAVATVDALEEQTFFITRLPASGLLAGSNVLAVEIHQASTTSSDMGFDLALTGSGTTAPHIVIGRPGSGQLFTSPADVPIEIYGWAGASRSIATVEIFSESGKLTELNTTPYRFTWPNAPFGSHTITARMTDNFGASVTSDPVSFTVGYTPVSMLLLASNSLWKYLDNGSNQGTNWSQPSFNDAAWASGPARLGYGGDGEETTVGYGPSATAKYITTYFRTRFVVPDDVVITNLTCKLVRDDGAVLWLNGRELYRSNMPAGAINYVTLASAAVSGTDEKTFFISSVATTNIVAGTNIIAVEIHQDAANSSDIGLDLEIDGDGYQLSSSAAPVLVPLLSPGSAECVLAWPASAAGWQLYTSPEIGPAALWQLVTTPTVVSNGQNTVLIDTSAGAAFYRLQKQ